MIKISINKKVTVLSFPLIFCLLLGTFGLSGCGSPEASPSEVISYVYEDETRPDVEQNGTTGVDAESTESGGVPGDTQPGATGNVPGKTNTGGATQPTVPAGKEPPVGGGDLTVGGIGDLKGKTIVIAGSPGQLIPPTTATSQYDTEQMKVLTELQKKYDFKLEYKRYDAIDFPTKAQTAIYAGSKFADIMLPMTHRVSNFIAAKLVRDLNQFPEMKIGDENLWVQSYLKQTQVYGKNLFAYTTLSDPGRSSLGLMFNKKILEQCGMTADELYQLVRDKKWTFSKMQQLSAKARKDLDGGGMGFNDQYGFCGVDMTGTISVAVYIAAGGESSQKNADGSYTNTFGSSKSVSAMTTMKNWLLKDSSVYNVKDTWENHTKLFDQGRCLFVSSWAYNTPAKTSNVQYGFVPFPAATENSAYKSRCEWNIECVTIPVNSSRDQVALASYYLQEVIPALTKVKNDLSKADMDKLRAYDANCIEMSEMIIKSGYLDGMLWGAGAGIGTIHRVMQNNADPAQDVKENNAGYTQSINQFNKYFKDAK